MKYIEYVKEIFKKCIPILIILAIIILVIVGIILAFKLKAELDLNRYTKFQENVQIVINKIEDINNLNQDRLGVDINNTDVLITYSKQIESIKSEFNIDVLNDKYLVLDSNHKHFLQIDDVEGTYIVNYDKGVVFCLDTVRYNKVEYFTSLELQKRLSNEYSYDFPIIPEGFKHVLGNWDTGYVISDSLGNEFVWIPVGMLNEEKPSEAFLKYYKNKKVKLNTEEFIEIEQSINKYGGFYISRYEASLKGATNETSKGNTNVLQVIKNVMPVSQVSFSTNNVERAKGYNQEGKSIVEGERKGALELAHSMAYDYKWNEKCIYTTLMYGEHYDTVLYIFDKLQLLNNKENNDLNPITQDSTLWGNYINSEFRYEKEGEIYTKNVNSGILLPTGSNLYKLQENDIIENNRIFNIYDFAGNLAEWTMDQKGEENIIRGGDFGSSGIMENVAKYTNKEPEYASGSVGIRVVLYIE